MVKLSPLEFYKLLINQEQIRQKKGKISFDLGNTNVIIKKRDVVGNIIQEWVRGCLDKNNVEYLPNPHTQKAPDFFLDINNKTSFLLEIKVFYYNRMPAFDIANFMSLKDELLKNPWALDYNYLIFGYLMSPDGEVEIKDVWLKKLWEITYRTEDWPLKLQVKKGIVYNVRPAKWFSDKEENISLFASKEHFLSALEECIYLNPSTHDDAYHWKPNFQSKWKDFYKYDIDFPRWKDIEGLYPVR